MTFPVAKSPRPRPLAWILTDQRSSQRGFPLPWMLSAMVTDPLPSPGVNLLPGDSMGTGWGHHLALCPAPHLAVPLPPSCLGQGLLAAQDPAPEALQPLLPLIPARLSRCAQGQECDIPIPSFSAAGEALALGQQTHLERATWARGTAGMDSPTSLGDRAVPRGGAGSCPCPARGVSSSSSSSSLCIAAASCLRRATATAPQRAEEGAAGAAWRARRDSRASAQSRAGGQEGPLLQEQPKGTWSRSWEKLQRLLMPNARRLLPGSSVEREGEAGAEPPRPRVPELAALGAPGITGSSPDER